MEEDDIITTLRSMEDDPVFVTESAYRANTVLWPDNKISFVEQHMHYLKLHPLIDPKHYIANLRLKLRRRF